NSPFLLHARIRNPVGGIQLKYAVLALGCALFFVTPAAAETLDNTTVIQLVKAGIGNDAVIAKIKATDGKYNLSTDDLIALKAQGVPGDVIAAMIGASTKAEAPVAAMSLTDIDPKTPHPSGVYLIDTPANRLDRIDPTVSNQAKTGGIFGYALTMGIASMSVKVSIAGQSARVVARTGTPGFYFFFDASNPATANITSSWAAGSAQTVSSPSEFTLIRLMEKKDRREARVGSLNIGGAKTGVMDHDRIAFDNEMVREGVYKVTPKQPLEAGQYGFIYALAGGGTGGAMTARIFDFSVPATTVAAR
ncbi:MAG: hypothetical protein QOF34_437, partial [Sphingomonadales bacterium]|nr:hypothetical protein [Sphingomonadales bacterium]